MISATSSIYCASAKVEN